MGVREEILEQPEVLRRLLDTQMAHVHSIASAIRKQEVDYVFLAARGTSDNAGVYAKYLWGASNKLPIALAAPSLFSVYGQPPHLGRALVVGISQSGQSPDILSVVREGRRQGAPTLVITNSLDSPLAQAAQYVLNISAGIEKAVAATKTYTAQLMSIAMLSAALNEDSSQMAALQEVPSLVQKALELDATVESSAERYRFMSHCIVLGRGYNYASVFEWSLKLKELAYIVAEPHSSADFRHGPIALVERGFPVLAIAPGGAVYDEMLSLLNQLADHGAELLIISDEEDALALAHTPLGLPATLPEWLSPIATIIPAQLFSYHLARVKGLDPELPRGLHKVTQTR